MTTNEPNAHDDDDDFMTEEEITEATLEITIDDATIDAISKGDVDIAALIGADDLLTMMLNAWRDTVNEGLTDAEDDADEPNDDD